MNFTHIPSFDECVNMTKNKDIFIRKDEVLDGVPIATFSYRLASYKDFYGVKGSFNMRGITFRSDTKELLALPLHKFWNLNENEFVTDKIFENKKILHVSEKYDGSLVYFFMLNNKLFCKTKLNCYAEQACWAMDIVNKKSDLKDFIVKQISSGFTPMFEFISPRNQIVVLYSREELKYICSRSMNTGLYDFCDYGLESVDKYSFTDVEKIMSAINSSDKNREGFVVVFEDHSMIKIKTTDYFNLHKIRENIYNENTLAEMILSEKLDDVKNFFKDDSNLLEYINNFESNVVNRYNFFKQSALSYFKDNKDLTRKEYAVKAKSVISDISFPLAMELYTNGEINEDKYTERFLSRKLWKD